MKGATWNRKTLGSEKSRLREEDIWRYWRYRALGSEGRGLGPEPWILREEG